MPKCLLLWTLMESGRKDARPDRICCTISAYITRQPWFASDVRKWMFLYGVQRCIQYGLQGRAFSFLSTRICVAPPYQTLHCVRRWRRVCANFCEPHNTISEISTHCVCAVPVFQNSSLLPHTYTENLNSLCILIRHIKNNMIIMQNWRKGNSPFLKSLMGQCLL